MFVCFIHSFIVFDSFMFVCLFLFYLIGLLIPLRWLGKHSLFLFVLAVAVANLFQVKLKKKKKKQNKTKITKTKTTNK